MNKFMEIVVYILAAIGLACVVKHIHITNCKEGCCLCNLFDTKVEASKKRAEGVKTKVEEIKTKIQKFKTKEKGEKRTGSRYGSNPVKY
ncbi:MAG TPA: hypothetical protein HA261_04055 [Methanosarcina sp.]|nr:hypothetical protein [Methanosarcina sp.]